MKTLTSRIKRRVLLLINNFKSDCAFSILYALLRVMDELCGRVHLNKLSNIAHEKKDKWILNYLERQLSDLIQKYKNIDDIGVFEENAPVWVCWWTGVEMAPDLVKQCIKSIRKQTGSHPVHVIDQNSYSVYIDIPDYMMHKVKNGQMGIAHLSDYIRVSLLEKYGGLWLDSTIFCASSLPESYFELPFFTCKSNPTSCGYLSQMRWTTFVLGGWRGNVFYRFIKEAFEEYWSQEQAAVDYLFFDYLIEVIGDHNCMELKGYIARCRFFVGARTHATIAAYSSCVPTLVLGYSVKSRGIARDLFGNEENYVLPVQSLQEPDELTKHFRWLVGHEKEIKDHLEKIMPEYISKAYSGKMALDKLVR